MSKLVIPGVVASAGNGGGGGGTGDYVQVITTSQFIMDPSQSVPIPVVDDIKDNGQYFITLDLSSLSPDMGMTYSLSVLNQGITVQIISVAGTGISFRRIFENNTWTEWENITDVKIKASLDEVEGYDSSKNQVLKNSSGNLEWSEDSGGGTIDQTYDPTSTNAQSGTAVAEAVAPALKNTATGTRSIAINVRGLSAVTSNNSLAIGSYIPSLIGNNSIAISPNGNVQASSSSLVMGNAHAINATGAIVISPSSYASCSATNAIQLGGGANNTAKTLQVYEWPLLDGTTGKIPADRIDMLVTVWNFSSSSYLTDRNIIDFESGTSYDFIYHFRTRESGTALGFLYASIDFESSTAGGFDLAHNERGELYISQSGKDGSGWVFDASLGDISNATDYWLRMTWDGATYTYVIATDADFTNIVNTTTYTSSKPIKNSTKPARIGMQNRGTTPYWRGKIYISDYIMKINGNVVFDGARGSNYTIVGNPTILSLLQ